MKTLSRSSALICLIPLLSLSAEWKVDPNHSTAGFAVRHMMVSTVHGSFSGLKGTVEYDPANLDASKANLTIDATTVDTRNENRDKDLKSSKFFDVEKYPTITFVSKRVVSQRQGKFQLVGDMTMHGVTKEVTFAVEGPMPAVKDAKGNLHSGATATAKINRKDFGLTWSGPLEGGGVTVGDEVELTVEIEMTQPKTT
ncbi:MAG: YceI family protein [Bryobacteraceae bacterium]